MLSRSPEQIAEVSAEPPEYLLLRSPDLLGDTEYKISARGRAGDIVKVLLDGEGSFITQGIDVDGRLEPKSFKSKIVSNGGTSEVSMAFDGGSVNELVATRLPGLDRGTSDRDEPPRCR